VDTTIEKLAIQGGVVMMKWEYIIEEFEAEATGDGYRWVQPIKVETNDPTRKQVAFDLDMVLELGGRKGWELVAFVAPLPGPSDSVGHHIQAVFQRREE
jgi:hypothetical protein